MNIKRTHTEKENYRLSKSDFSEVPRNIWATRRVAPHE